MTAAANSNRNTTDAHEVTTANGADPGAVEDVADLPPLVRWRRAVKALVRVMVHPEETDQVLVFSNLANAGRRGQRMHLFFGDPRGARLYAEARAIDSRTIDLDELANLP